MRNLFILGTMLVGMFMAGWFTINRQGDTTTIEINRSEIRSDTQEAISRGREFLERRDQEAWEADQQQSGDPAYAATPYPPEQAAPNQYPPNQYAPEPYGPQQYPTPQYQPGPYAPQTQYLPQEQIARQQGPQPVYRIDPNYQPYPQQQQSFDPQYWPQSDYQPRPQQQYPLPRNQ